MNKNLQDIAKKVLAKANIPEDKQFGSVIAILMIISIILTTIRVIQECNKNKSFDNFTKQEKYTLYGSQIKEFSKKRGWFTKMRLKKILRQHLNKEDYITYSTSIIAAMLNTGENLMEDEVITLVENANV